MWLLSALIIAQWFSSSLLNKICLYKFTFNSFLFCMCFVHLPSHRDLSYKSSTYILELLLNLLFSQHIRLFLPECPFFPLVLLYFRALRKLKTDNGPVKWRSPLEMLLRTLVYASFLRIIGNAAYIIYINVNYYWKRWEASLAINQMTLGFSKEGRGETTVCSHKFHGADNQIMESL